MYDNAKANAIMQQANTILNLEKKLTKSKLNETRREIYEKCGPLVSVVVAVCDGLLLMVSVVVARLL